MKKVLIFSLTYHPFIGGAEIALKEITNRIDSKDIEFDMITLRFDKKLPKFERIGKINVYRIGFGRNFPKMADLSTWPLKLNKYLFPLLGLSKALRLNRKRKYDGIWNMMATYSAFAGLFFKLLKPEVKYLLTLQEGDPIKYIRKRTGFLYPIFKKIFNKADLIQVISTYLGKWAKAEGYNGPLLVVPNGVDVEGFSKTNNTHELEELKNKLGKKEGDIFLITTSRLVKKNACDDVIRALTLMPLNIKFIIAGTGPDEKMLRSLAEENGVSDRVIFVGQIDNDDLSLYLQISDIFIRPSLSEGFGISFIEAMAMGLPVIATQEGGIEDFLFDPVRNPENKPTGRAVNPRDEKGIAQAVEIYLSDKKTTQEIIANAKEMVKEKYDWKLIAKDMKEQVFVKLLE